MTTTYVISKWIRLGMHSEITELRCEGVSIVRNLDTALATLRQWHNEGFRHLRLQPRERP